MKSPLFSRLLAREPAPDAPDAPDDRGRRLDQRHALSLPVAIVADGLTIDAESLDVGFGGMCIRADVTHAPGNEVTLAVTLPERATPALFSARIVWRQRALVGLHFTDVTPMQLWLLSRVFPR